MALPFIILLICLCHQVKSDINLVSSPPGGSTLYNRQPISVTCTTTASQVLAWESAEYIGQGRLVSVSLSDSPGTTVPLPDLNVTVLVVSTSNTPGQEMIKSSLQVTVAVTSTCPKFTITCRNNINASGLTKNVTFRTTNEPGTDLVVAEQRVCPGEGIYIDCIAKNAVLIQLNTNFSTDPINCTRNDAASQNLTVNGVPFVLDKHYSTDTDGTTTLTCNVTINVDDLPNSIFGQNLSISCKNHGLAIRVNKTVHIANADDCANAALTSDAVKFDLTTVNTKEITMNHASPLSTSKVVNIIFLGLIGLLC